MSVATTTGVGVLARLIKRLGDGSQMTAAAFAAEEGFARSTVFDISRRMEAAGLVQRDLNGALSAGPALVKLSLAEYGLAPLSGPAEALLQQLRDETQATVRLWADERTILRFAARRADTEGVVLEAPLTERSKVTLRLRINATRAERDDAQMRLGRCVLSLKHYLATDRADKKDGDADG